MHWNKNIIALKAQGKTIQVFDLQAKQKLKSAVMTEDVVFWKWYSETSIGLITESSVYHWNVFDPTQHAPLKMFDRIANLAVRFTSFVPFISIVVLFFTIIEKGKCN